MGLSFQFATANRIVFGAGSLKEAVPVAEGLGTRALLVTGAHPARAEPLRKLLSDSKVAVVDFSVPGEPAVDGVEAGVAAALEGDCDLAIGYGGGSAIDAAKAIAALATNPGEPLDYLEVVGKGQALTRDPLPCIAIPTTAGTGAEVTKNAVLASPEHRVKVSLRHPLMLPNAAIVDPELTHSLPPAVTASTGLDALTQVIEPFTCCRTNPMTDALALEGIRRAGRSLRRACEAGDDPGAREDMAVASLFGGLALANSGLGAVHGFAGPLGGMFPAPHGAVCAVLLPQVMRANAKALYARAPDQGTLLRYESIARLLTGELDASIEDGIDWVEKLVRDLEIPGLGTYGVTENDVSTVVGKAMNASSMKANPLPLTEEELRGVLRAAL